MYHLTKIQLTLKKPKRLLWPLGKRISAITMPKANQCNTTVFLLKYGSISKFKKFDTHINIQIPHNFRVCARRIAQKKPFFVIRHTKYIPNCFA